MQTKHAIVFILVGFCIDFVGVTLKLLHHSLADIVIIIAMVFKVIGTLVFLYKLLSYPKFKDFLDW